MRWALSLMVTWLATSLSLGCRQQSIRRDLLESELRAREEDVHTLRSDLHKSESTNRLLLRELMALRGTLGPDGNPLRPTDPYPISRIVLGNQTRGRSNSKGDGDDALEVFLEPRDLEGHAIKAPGTLWIEAIEVSPEGLKRPLSQWEINPEELKRSWRNGLFTTGYSLTLPWKVFPTQEKLRIVARFQLTDGRTFEADRDVSVRIRQIHFQTPADTRRN